MLWVNLLHCDSPGHDTTKEFKQCSNAAQSTIRRHSDLGIRHIEAVQICRQAHLLPGSWTGTLLWPEANSSLKVSTFNMASADSIKTCSCSTYWLHGSNAGQYNGGMLMQRRELTVSRSATFSRTSLKHKVCHNGKLACSTEKYHEYAEVPQNEAHCAVLSVYI